MKAWLVLLVCLGCVSLAAAGCGGGGGGEERLSKQEYEQQMQDLQQELSPTADQLQSASDPTDIEAMTEGLREAADLLDQASEGLQDISPPEDVADPHQEMAAQSAAAADSIREFADTIETAPLSELQTRLAEFQNIEEFDKLEAAVVEIQAAGYDIGGFTD